MSLATVTLSQSISFWHAGTELLRSKSLDRNSYNSGDWFNRIDWTGQESTFGSGLPMEADNGEKWPLMAPLLANPALKPAASDIASRGASAGPVAGALGGRPAAPGLGGADRAEGVVPERGTDAAPGVIVMVIDDLLGENVDPELEGALVVFNASPDAVTQTVDALEGRSFALTPALANGSDPVVKTTTWDAKTGTVTVPARSVAVLVDVEDVDTAVFTVPNKALVKAGTPVKVTGGCSPTTAVLRSARSRSPIAARSSRRLSSRPRRRARSTSRCRIWGAASTSCGRPSREADGWRDSQSLFAVPVVVF